MLSHTPSVSHPIGQRRIHTHSRRAQLTHTLIYFACLSACDLRVIERVLDVDAIKCVRKTLIRGLSQTRADRFMSPHHSPFIFSLSKLLQLTERERPSEAECSTCQTIAKQNEAINEASHRPSFYRANEISSPKSAYKSSIFS